MASLCAQCSAGSKALSGTRRRREQGEEQLNASTPSHVDRSDTNVEALLSTLAKIVALLDEAAPHHKKRDESWHPEVAENYLELFFEMSFRGRTLMPIRNAVV